MRLNAEIGVDEHVGARLRGLRMMRGVTQEKLAESVGITFQQVQKYEKGQNRMSAGRLTEFGRVLEVQPAYFFDGLPRTGSNSEPIPASIRQFASSREGIALARAFQELAPAKRMAVVALVKEIGRLQSGEI